MIGATPVAANSAMTGRGDPKRQGDRKRTNPNRDGGGRFRKAQKSSNSETYTKESTRPRLLTLPLDRILHPKERVIQSARDAGKSLPTTIAPAPRASVHVDSLSPPISLSVTTMITTLHRLSLPIQCPRCSLVSSTLTRKDQLANRPLRLPRPVPRIRRTNR